MRVSTVNSIEIASVCNLACPYCPAKDQHNFRSIGLMESDVFEKAIDWALHFARKGTQREINLFGIGEPLLHPKVLEYVAYARKTLPFRQVLHINTNGVLMTDEIARELKDAGISQVDVTGHDHYHTAKTVRILARSGMDFNVSYDFAIRPNNWAGQVDWFAPLYHKQMPCPWTGRGQVMIMSDGRVTRCCIDAFATGVMGTVDDDVAAMDVTPFALCEKCHHTTEADRRIVTPAPGFLQMD